MCDANCTITPSFEKLLSDDIVLSIGPEVCSDNLQPHVLREISQLLGSMWPVPLGMLSL